MAITRAQQARQMLKDGNFVMQGGVRNYLGKQKTVSDAPLKWQSGPDKPSTELAYITKAEKDLILKKIYTDHYLTVLTWVHLELCH